MSYRPIGAHVTAPVPSRARRRRDRPIGVGRSTVAIAAGAGGAATLAAIATKTGSMTPVETRSRLLATVHRAMFTSPLAESLATDLLDRFLRYVRVDTQSERDRKQSPSTPGQL